MDILKNGESSTTPSPSPRTGAAAAAVASSLAQAQQANGHSTSAAGGIGMDVDADVDIGVPGAETGSMTLIMPEWDVPPPKPLHQSLDLISLLHLDGYYNTYVRPFADDPSGPATGPSSAPAAAAVAGDTSDKKPFALAGSGVAPPVPGQKKGKKKRLEKGYQHLLEDCIDPTPLGTKADSLSLLPLVPDMTVPPSAPPPALQYGAGPLEILSAEAFRSARLEVGKQDGYAGGEKLGVREAEERRKKKKAGRALTVDPSLPSPSPAPAQSSAALHSPSIPGTPGTPLLPVPPPRSYQHNHLGRRPTAPPNLGHPGQPVKPFPPGATGAPGAPGRPYAPNKRPGSADVQLGPHKRAKSGTGSRCASPLPQPGQLPFSTQHQQQARKLPPGGRSRTEGL